MAAGLNKRPFASSSLHLAPQRGRRGGLNAVGQHLRFRWPALASGPGRGCRVAYDGRLALAFVSVAKRLNRDPSGAPNGPAPDLIIFRFFIFSHALVRPLTYREPMRFKTNVLGRAHSILRVLVCL